MSVPWRDKAGITHAWDATRGSGPAGWYTVWAPCGASRRLQSGRDDKDRPRDADIDCMNCLVLLEIDNI